MGACRWWLAPAVREHGRGEAAALCIAQASAAHPGRADEPPLLVLLQEKKLIQEIKKMAKEGQMVRTIGPPLCWRMIENFVAGCRPSSSAAAAPAAA